jgi:hypothetical protein
MNELKAFKFVYSDEIYIITAQSEEAADEYFRDVLLDDEIGEFYGITEIAGEALEEKTILVDREDYWSAQDFINQAYKQSYFEPWCVADSVGAY